MNDSLPDGAFACFDIYDGMLVAISESKNKVVKSTVGDFHNVQSYGFPSSYNRQFYHWCKVNFVNENVIVALLKRHEDRSFHLVSFLLDNTLEKCTIISHAKTYVYSFGLRVEAHRSGSQFVYIICNSKKPIIKYKEVDGTVSFMKQLSEAIHQDNEAGRVAFVRSSNNIEENSSPSAIHECDTTSTELDVFETQPSTSGIVPIEEEPLLSRPENSSLQVQLSVARSSLRRDDEKSVSSVSTTYQDFVESVILLVKCDAHGTIFENIVSTGRQRYGIKLRRAPSLRKVRRSFRSKVMTRWQSETAEELCEPFLWADQVIVIPRKDPSRIFATKTVTNVQSGLMAALLAVFGRLCGTTTTNFSTTQVSETTEERVLGRPPNPTHLWSNVDFCGDPRILTLDPESGECKVYQLCRPTRLSYEWLERKVSLSQDVANSTKVSFRVDPKHHSNLLVRTSRGEAAHFNQFQIANELC